MNTFNYNEPGSINDASYVGVDNNKLVVTTRVRSFGTFAVTTDDVGHAFPWNRASGMRISNLSGKIIGIRKRHKTVIVDNFEDGKFPEWIGTIASADDLGDGFVGATVSGDAYRPLNNEVVLDGTEVSLTFRPESNHSVTIAIFDDPSRIGMDPAGYIHLTPSNSQSNTKQKVTFRLEPTKGTYNVYLEDVEKMTRETLVTDATAEFGTNNMIGSIIRISDSGTTIFDPLVLEQKVNYAYEQISHGGTFNYPCFNNTSEYEVVNLGTDYQNYTDNTQTISISGFYSV